MFCLMPNHFHLLLHCPEGGFSEFMQRVGGQFATHVCNWRYASDGPLVRGRFHSIAVDTPEYQATVGSYIHRNSIDLPPVDHPESYRWSNFRYDTTGVVLPSRLHTEALLCPFGDRDAYRAFVVGRHGRMLGLRCDQCGRFASQFMNWLEI